jgi:putative ABC transport system permease protein
MSANKGRDNMFSLEREIKRWKQGLAANPTLEDGYIAELESHVRDKVEDLVRTGMSPKEAFFEVTAAMGQADDIGREFYKAHTIRRSGRPSWQPPRFMPALAWNYFKIALRKIKRQKAYSFINISGLAVGMACCILLLLWVRDELGYDKFHENGGRIFRVVSVDRAGGGDSWDTGSPAPLGQALGKDYPEVLKFTRMQTGWAGWNLHLGEKVFLEAKLAAVDPAFFEVFHFPFVKGDPKTALQERFSVVLTESLAGKFFGDNDPMGRTLQMSEVDLRVTGVIQDIPRNSHIQFDYAFPLVNMTAWRSSKLESWRYMQCATYLELKGGIYGQEFSKKISGIVKNHDPASKVELSLQPLSDIHLRSSRINNFAVEYPNPGNITYVYIFSLTAFCVLLLACINYMNLATARFGTRAKEVGVRKTAGAGRRDLVRQFLGESILMSLTSLVAALLLVLLMIPAFNRLSGKKISPSDLGDPQTVLGLIGITLLVGVLAGIYPAFFLSSFHPAKVLKGIANLGTRRGGKLRKILVVSQFAFTIILLTATLVIYSQLKFIQNKDLGFDKSNIVSFAGYGQYERNFDATKQELLQNPAIVSVSRCFPPGPGFEGTTNVDWEGKDPSREVVFYFDEGDYDFLKTFGLTMAEGRFYSREFPTDAGNFVINETAAKLIGPASSLGKKFSYQARAGTIIGVMKDYFGGSLHAPIQPKVVKLSNGFFISVKFKPGMTSEVMTFLEQKWKKFVPGRPFRYHFLDEDIDSNYKTERQTGKVFRSFAILAVIIACLGLFGLASYTAEQRTKEIGIRKVLGAKASGIVLLMTKEFIKWVLLANIIAWPAAYFLMSRWLGRFAYRISLGPGLFLFSAGSALLIALATVSYQAIRAALDDPVKSLRYE